MRLLPSIHYGTEGYPDKVARRLRAVNITVWLGALIPAIFAIIRFVDPPQGVWARGIVNVLFAAILVSIPLPHRFGPLVAPLTLIAVVYAFLFRTSIEVGTGGGAYLSYLSATALGILLIGIEHIYVAAALGAAAVALIIAVHLVAPHDTGLLSPTSLFYGNFVTNVVANDVILFAVVYYAVRQAVRAEAAAERAHERSESLLRNILPPRIAERLKERAPALIADRYNEASVLFADMAGFTARASDTAPEDLVRFLNGVFTRLDALVERHGLEKIKTTGDAYMVVSGIPEPRPDHAAALADLALEMRATLAGLVDPMNRAVPVRIGIASGPVVAGVVGTRKFFYDVWGDTVNTASRMESTGEAGKIQVSQEARAKLSDGFELEDRGVIDVPGKGPMRTWFLLGRRAAP